MTTLWAFILVLSGLILVHELGHFLVARGFGIRVLKFSIGFGPRIVGFEKGGTDYCISAIPLGGFVKMLGEQPNEPIPDELKHLSFSHKPVWQKALVVAAGPLSNIFFATFIFFWIFMIAGQPILLPVVGSVQKGSPAQHAGIKPGDEIISVDGKKIDSWDELSLIIRSSKGKQLLLEIKRDKKTLFIKITPKVEELKDIFGEKVKIPVIGVTAKGVMRTIHLSPLKALKDAFISTWNITVLTVQSFIKLIERVIPLSTLGGPILIAKLAGQQAKQGLMNLFYFMAVLSINLGLLNLLPIPVLDGGHLMFFLFEAVTGRPLSMRQMEIAQQIGIIILGALMLLVFYNDIARVLGFGHLIGGP